MQNTYIWRIVPSSQPHVFHNCGKCGSHSEFECSGNFRVNANKNNIDVWLIYQCTKCKTTWNMDILSRIDSSIIDKELYLKFLRNDPELAERYAFDVMIHIRNNSVLNYDNILYKIVGDCIEENNVDDDIHIELLCDYPLELRLDRLLSKQLGVSREVIKKWSSQGKIYCEGIKNIAKAKIKNGMNITIARPIHQLYTNEL